ncbi:Homoserine dehydrogenase [Candidatus Hydrogenisulfobacillus filiaventi]|uniref:Homoserine dehydrogenase n=1 Tax=Candidatus Hydrogenisulfobacillus filiaventi TaxID=2707344 RepID=A0A6F8ZGB8_9FIRM|nr:homoserine dehydrogenase [Bacillota bacterium]CAB1128642.1 Homoserine dehydrogenase [Candidatus Hydrogenisulfobacillus filiaventi]
MTALAEVRIGLLGFGTVGQAVARLLREHGPWIEARTGKRLVLVGALVRNPDRHPDAGIPLTTRAEDLLDHRTADIVVEVLGGVEPALTYITAAMEQGQSVVTANKEVLAYHGSDLAELARRRGVALAFEASVAGGTPLLDPLLSHLALTPVYSISAVLNGTTNFMLNAMEEGLDFAQALRRAQRLGYAEADPGADLSGQDAVRKLVLLVREVWGVDVRPEAVPVLGIEALSPAVLARMRRIGLRVRLVAQAVLDCSAGCVQLAVLPRAMGADHLFASLKGPDNAIAVRTATGDYTLIGPGAGGLATAHAVLADLVRVAAGYRPPQAPADAAVRLAPDPWREQFWVLGGEDAPEPEGVPWEPVARAWHLTPPLTVAEVADWLSRHPGFAAVTREDPEEAGSDG